MTLKRRKGFIKLAIRQGADLVPVFSFGENDVRLTYLTNDIPRADESPMPVQIFQQMSNQRGSRLYRAQKKFQAVFGFTLRASSPTCEALRMAYQD